MKNGFRKATEKDRTSDGLELYEKIRMVQDLKDSYFKYWEADLARYARNARSLWHLNFGAWPAAVVQALREKGKTPKTFPLLLDKAETFIGSIMGNGYDIRYAPVTGKMNSLILKLQEMRYSDKKDMMWEVSEMEALLDCTCGVGFESMIVSSRNHPLGNIGFARRNPRRVLLSPAWKTHDVNDLKDWFTWGRFTVSAIMDMFPIKSERIKARREEEEKNAIDYGLQEGIQSYNDANQKWTDEHVVIEQHWIVREIKQWELDKKNGCLFPETFYPFHSKEDIAEKLRYVQLAGLTQDDIMLQTKTQTTKYIRAICPTLDAELMLVDGKDLIQCGNCNIFPIGLRMDGQYQGLTDRLIGIDKALNNNQLRIEEIQDKAAGQSAILDSAIAGENGELKADIERQAAENKIIWAAPHSLEDVGKGAMIQLPGGTVSADIFKQGDSLLTLADRFSKVSASEDGRTQYAGEPNKLFENKVAMGKIGKWFFSKLYEIFVKNKALAYAKQAKYTYAGVEREFSSKDGKPIKINSIVEQNGKRKVLDAISMLPNVKVTAILAKDGIEINSQIRDDLGVYLQAVQTDREDRALKLELLKSLFERSPLPEEEKETLGKTTDLMLIRERLAIAISIKTLMGQAQAPGTPSVAGQIIDNSQQRAGFQDNSKEIEQQMSDNIPDEETINQGTPNEQMVAK